MGKVFLAVLMLLSANAFAGTDRDSLVGYTYTKSYSDTVYIPTQLLNPGEIRPYSGVIAQTDVMDANKALVVKQFAVRLMDKKNSLKVGFMGGNERLTDSTRWYNIAFCNIPVQTVLFIIGKGDGCNKWAPILFSDDFVNVPGLLSHPLAIEANLVFINSDSVAGHNADAEVTYQIDEYSK